MKICFEGGGVENGGGGNSPEEPDNKQSASQTMIVYSHCYSEIPCELFQTNQQPGRAAAGTHPVALDPTEIAPNDNGFLLHLPAFQVALLFVDLAVNTGQPVYSCLMHGEHDLANKKRLFV